MRKNDDAYEKRIVSTFINVLLSIFKWLCLGVCVVNAGLTIGLLVMGLLNGENLANTLLSKMFNIMTFYTETEALALVDKVGKIDMLVAGVGYGFLTSLTYGLIYSLTSKFKVLFKDIVDGNMFTKENLKMINDAIPMTILVAFAPPVIMYSIIYSTNIFSYENIEVSGIIFIFIAFILKLIFEKGVELEKKNIKYDKELSDFKARESELKLSALKEKIEKTEAKDIKVKKTPVKKEKITKENNKKVTKRATKK